MNVRWLIIGCAWGCSASPEAPNDAAVVIDADAAVGDADVPDAAERADVAEMADGAEMADLAEMVDGAELADGAEPDRGPDAEPGFVAVTFNTGSAVELAHDREPDDGYSEAHAELTDTWYGNGLAWTAFVIETQAFFARLDPDIVAFQEIFDPSGCAEIPEEAQLGYVCEDFEPGDPTVAERLVGPDFQVACHPGKPDKCVAVHSRFGRFRGCDEARCPDALAGGPVPNCGSGARIARGVIDRTDGSTLTIVSVHGTSGLNAEDQACRAAQVAQVFDDLDGEPAANGAVNLILGDFNTDPARFAAFDASAQAWTANADGQRFHFLSAVGPDVPGTYANGFNIDHVISDALQGECWSAGIEGHPPVTDAVFFDHLPLVCRLR